MKGKTFKALLSLLMVVAMVTASGCSLLEDNSTRPSRESVESTSNREGSNGKEVDIDVTPLKVDGTSMYVTGIEKNIALREADEDTSEVLAQLTLQEEVKFITNRVTFRVTLRNNILQKRSRRHVKNRRLTLQNRPHFTILTRATATKFRSLIRTARLKFLRKRRAIAGSFIM